MRALGCPQRSSSRRPSGSSGRTRSSSCVSQCIKYKYHYQTGLLAVPDAPPRRARRRRALSQCSSAQQPLRAAWAAPQVTHVRAWLPLADAARHTLIHAAPPGLASRFGAAAAPAPAAQSAQRTTSGPLRHQPSSRQIVPNPAAGVLDSRAHVCKRPACAMRWRNIPPGPRQRRAPAGMAKGGALDYYLATKVVAF